MHDHRASHAGAGGCRRSSAIIRKISWNICRGMATSAVWKATLRADLDQLLLRTRQRPVLTWGALGQKIEAIERRGIVPVRRSLVRRCIAIGMMQQRIGHFCSWLLRIAPSKTGAV